MQFDISRDYLDGLMIQQPATREGLSEIRAAGQLHFLPSSPDGRTTVCPWRLALPFYH
jgi:hypothetical protein